MEKVGDTNFTGLTITTGITTGGTLARNFGYRFNKVVKEKLLYIIRRVVAFSTPYTHGNSQLAPQEITFLVSELKPSLQEGMGGGVHPRVVVRGANDVTISLDDLFPQGSKVVFHLADVVFDAAKTGNTSGDLLLSQVNELVIYASCFQDSIDKCIHTRCFFFAGTPANP
jgi:hypothetical protein